MYLGDCRLREAFSRPRSQHFALIPPFSLTHHAYVVMTICGDRKIWIMQRTNQTVGFIAMPSWKKNMKDNPQMNITDL